MVSAAQPAWAVSPFRIASQEEFARLREVFEQGGYTESQLCERAGADVTSVFDLWPGSKRSSFASVTDAQSLLVRLFFDGDAVSAKALDDLLPRDHIETLRSFDLIYSQAPHEDMVATRIAIYPIEGLYIASDRLSRPFAEASGAAPMDLVFSPILPQTRAFLRLMPRERCESFLELCGGSGVAALVGAQRFASHATVVDITDRSTRCAAFNAALNGVSNVSALEGDLYAPLVGETFDLIVAHPPYVPALESRLTFRDGGIDGEGITSRIFEGLADHLRPGGQCFVDCLMSSREGMPVEQRVREMLGSSSQEFDVVVAQGATLDPLHFMLDQACEGLASFADLEEWRDTFRRLDVDGLVMASVLVQRKSTARPVITTRRVRSSLTSGGDMQWMMRWMVTTASWAPSDELRLLSSHPRTLPRTELRSRSRLVDGQWYGEECALVTLAPFAVEATCPSWYATLLQWCDGRMTAREHLQYLRDTHAVPDDAPEEAFARMIRQLLDAGLVEIDEFRLPDATAMRDTVGVRDRARDGQPVERAD